MSGCARNACLQGFEVRSGSSRIALCVDFVFPNIFCPYEQTIALDKNFLFRRKGALY
jgi:hypothetical protein